MNNYIISVRQPDTTNDTFQKYITHRPVYLVVPENVTDPLPSHSVSTTQTWMNSILDQAKTNGSTDIVLFVHGFNTSPAEALERQVAIQSGLQIAGTKAIVIGFD